MGEELSMRRRNIALFTALPESVHAKNVITGIAAQCKKYDYNVLVFASMMHLESSWREYLKGEKKIYELPDLNMLDGVILDTANLIENKNRGMISEIRNLLKDREELPVVTLELKEGDYPVIPSRNENILREMVRHLIDAHGIKQFCILTGPKGYDISETRLKILADEIKKHGLTIKEEHIIYGDFWYTSGDRLARELASGRISMPQAVICVTDFAALGLIDRLSALGIRIPEDILVVGFDTTDEGQCSRIILSSFDTADTAMAADAVDVLRNIIDPEKEIYPYAFDEKRAFHPGLSCGCTPDYGSIMKSIRKTAYFTSHNDMIDAEDISTDFGLLMESYYMETFSAAKNPEDCIRSIAESTYLLQPFKDFTLCLSEKWPDGNAELPTDGYGRLKRVLCVRQLDDGSLAIDEKPVAADVWDALLENGTHDEASISYFSSIHFKGDFMGYAVIRRSISGKCLSDQIYRTWLRFVNNALEMIRAKRQLTILSVRDGMTGLYNRRGMHDRLEEMFKQATEGEYLFVAVIDMDGLKTINDTYGHGEGDVCIRIVSSAVAQITGENEICVRAGGDEFYIIGIGVYDENEGIKRAEELKTVIGKIAIGYQKPYTVSASFGCAFEPVTENMNVDSVISRADEKMYKCKVAKNIQRK